MKRWTVGVASEAKKQLAQILDQRVHASILERLRGLEYESEKQGKSLRSELAGYRSLRAVGQRYQIRDNEGMVYVVLVGICKEGDKTDAYALAKKLLRSGLFE